MKEKNNLGKEGENKAVEFLKKQGYEIIERNYLKKGIGEIDIIAIDKRNKELIFIEVRTRKGKNYFPEYTVNDIKIKRIVKTSQRFIYENKIYEDYLLRYDIVAINYSNTEREWIINHYKDVVRGK